MSLQASISRLNGAPEVSAAWTHDHLGEFTFIDVREPHELEGPLGSTSNAQNIPLQRFLNQTSAHDLETPLVLICRSGRRSAMAATAYEAAGFKQVASVEGGMLAWKSQVEGLSNVHYLEKQANTEHLSEAVYHTNNLPEVSCQWVAQNFGRFRLVDVRQAHELSSPLGKLLQAEHVPLDSLDRASADWDRSVPVVVLCRSGGRSGFAAVSMIKRGFEHVASMEGGMLAWNSIGLPHS